MSLGHGAYCFYGENEQREIICEKYLDAFIASLLLFHAPVIPSVEFKIMVYAL